MYVPDPEYPGCRQTDDVLVLLITRDVHDGKQVSDELASGPGEDVRVPHSDHLVHAPRGDDIGLGTVLEGVHSLRNGDTSNLRVIHLVVIYSLDLLQNKRRCAARGARGKAAQLLEISDLQ